MMAALALGPDNFQREGFKFVGWARLSEPAEAWVVDDDGIYRIYEPFGEYNPDKEVVVMDPLSVSIKDPLDKKHLMQPKLDNDGKPMTAKSLIEGKTIKAAKYYGPEFAYTIGTAYGYIVKRYNHTQNLINSLKKNLSL